MKKLVILAHPNMGSSVINKRWVEELSKHSGEVEVHDLYASYPDWKIDVEKEQRLLEAHDTIVLEFPVQWFNCTPLLKLYLDDVFTYGWAYGSTGDKLKGKKLALAITTGSPTSVYSHDGKNGCTLDELFLPMKTTATFCGMQFCGIFTQGGSLSITPEQVDESAKRYLKFVEEL